MKRITLRKTLAALLLTMLTAASASAAPWKFGIISDTQWTTNDPANQNPNTVPASIIKQVNQQLINKGVQFVIAMGDQVDEGSQTNNYTRTLYSQDLYNAGIGFYPIRGNHEAAFSSAYMNTDADFWHAYPQLTNGMNNATPSDITTSLIPAAVMAANPPVSNTGSTFFIGAGFSYPTVANTTNHSVSYSFQYNNATFMMLDQFQSPDYYTSHIIPEQQDWISGTLSGRPANTHAFAFTHKNILGGNHKDNMFGGNATNDPGDGYGLDPSTVITNTPGLTVGQKQANENTFLGLLQANKVKYMISGHDHHHYNSIVTSPDQQSKVHELICASDSSKFYTPGFPVSGNDAPVEQDLQRIGYYIFTVDGPRVTIDYYGDNHGGWQSDGNYPLGTTDLVNYPKNVTPSLTFVKRSTTGYSLNGIEKLVARGASYAMTDDTTKAATMEYGILGTSMSILSGTNNSTVVTNYGKPTSKAVNTGWAPQAAGNASDTLTLWGMYDVAASSTDTFALSISYDDATLKSGVFGLSTKNGSSFVKAVDLNVGGAPQFVNGPYVSGYPLGTYGIDPASKTAWAVINHASDFAVAPISVSDISGQISASTGGFVYNRATKLYTGKLTITNTGSAINVPVAVALDGLTSGVTLSNALGQYNSAPYTTVTNSGLGAGASITIPLTFANPSNAKINFTPVTFQE
jgi:hypothetical protein